MIAALYDQTLSRTYVNAQGQRVMLSIAYGGDQSKQLQLHHPEVCYVAQGFDMLKDRRDELATGFGKLPVKRLVARQNARNEPITYWVTIGDKAVMSGLDQKLQRFMYGLSGRIPDGMLVRVSTIEADEGNAYKVQDRFVNQMLSALDPQARSRLLGAATTHG
jgi:EpsI family protein